MSETLRRAVDTLDAMARADGDLSIRELAEATQVSKSAVQRLLTSLVETGLAVQDGSTRRYGLGPRTLVLGTAYQRRIDLRAVAMPHLTALRDTTGETVGLSVRVGDELLHVDQVESTSALRRTFDVGRSLPLWCGAPSRVLLADLPRDEVDRIVRARRPAAVVPVAPPTARALLADVTRTRRRGYAVARGETIAGVTTVAAGLRGARGRVAATVSVTGPSSRLNEDALRVCVPGLLATSATVSRLLGERG